MNGQARRRTAVAALPLLLAGLTAGCTEDAPEEPVASETPTATQPSAAPAPADAKLRTRVGTVTGDLRKARRRAVARRVSATVDRWLRAAWIGGQAPPERFGRVAFPAFTRDAWRQARRDRRLLSMVQLAPRVDDVHVRRREVTVDLLAPGGRPAGATAHVRLVLVTSGDVERRVALRGRLFLTPGKGGRWRTFGYDVARDVVPTARSARGKRKGNG